MPQHAKRLALVTGTSSGIGEAVARELLRRGWEVVGISRRRGAIESPGYTHLSLDLADLAGMAARLDATLAGRVGNPSVGRLGLVNNAADPGLLGPVERLDPVALLRVCAQNLAAPVGLMGWLVRRGAPGIPVRIVNLSSGAAVHPYAGLGAYGTTKAGLRMAGMVLAAELDAGARDATILSYEPGAVDTPMQATARATPVEVLPTLEMFRRAAADGHLIPPTAPAGDVADYLDGDAHPRFSERRYAASPRLTPRA